MRSDVLGDDYSRLAVTMPSLRVTLNADNTVKGETLGGPIAPMDFTIQRTGTGGHAASDCWTEDLLADGHLVHMGPSGQVVNRLVWICGTGARHPDSEPPLTSS